MVPSEKKQNAGGLQFDAKEIRYHNLPNIYLCIYIYIHTQCPQKKRAAPQRAEESYMVFMINEVLKKIIATF